MKRILSLFAFVAFLAPVAGHAAEARDYTNVTQYCSNYDASPEFYGVDSADNQYKLLGRDYKGRAYVLFPTTIDSNGNDTMQTYRVTNVKNWAHFYRLSFRHLQCEDGYQYGTPSID